jgi:hypothetical protein
MCECEKVAWLVQAKSKVGNNSALPRTRLKYKTPRRSPLLFFIFSYPNGNQRHPLRLLKLDREPKRSKMWQTLRVDLRRTEPGSKVETLFWPPVSKPCFSYFILPVVLFPAVLYPAVLLLLLLCQPRQSPHRSLRSFRRRAGCSDLRGRLAFNCQQQRKGDRKTGQH